MPTHELMRKGTEFLFLCDMTEVPGPRVVSIGDLAMRVEQLNHLAVLIHIENEDEASCMRLVNRETKVSRLKTPGVYARMCGSAMLCKVLRRHMIVLRRRDAIEGIFRDSECGTIEFLLSKRASQVLTTPRFLIAALQHRDWEVTALLLRYKPLDDIVDVAKYILSGKSRASSAQNRALAVLAARLLDRGESFTIDRQLLRTGERLLGGAVMTRQKRLVDKLLGLGEPVHEQSNGTTLLELAAERREVEIAMKLFEYGAKRSALFRGRSTVDNAREKGYEATSQAIARYVADHPDRENVARCTQRQPDGGVRFIHFRSICKASDTR
ncbi:hypothetical protein ColLi_12925 [Colletotrichum liriopes]|uniref:Ankyrin repeat protein n=1 Tax=Colletotrichum liriopes TaxID=708192 RepID=A0AA37LZ32_9PEZI|nr:hypothetical protein ColLi_12925 [Colletotrichum liriopes]